MKKILITGKESYIGTSFEKWVSQWPEKYSVTAIEVKSDSWEYHDFTKYDVVIHMAAIVHVKEKSKEAYYIVNRDLTYKIAQKAKSSGISYFIFMSTMGVYGLNIGKIDPNLNENPKTHYAISKLEAESLLKSLSTDRFKILVLRPPLVYGPNCKGNYLQLSSLAKKIRFFPKMNNIRSMIFIDNLSEFIRLSIDRELVGIHYPSNKDYVNVSNLIKEISIINGNKIFFSRFLNVFVKILMIFSSTFKKVFGYLIYSEELTNTKEITTDEYSTCSFHDSLVLTEKN